MLRVLFFSRVLDNKFIVFKIIDNFRTISELYFLFVCKFNSIYRLYLGRHREPKNLEKTENKTIGHHFKYYKLGLKYISYRY